MPGPGGLTAAAYLRVSKEEQAEKDLSIPAQKDRIVAYCQSQGWVIGDFYVDDGYSAKDLVRPEMGRLIEDCIRPKIDVVVVVRLDRISRRQKDVLYLIEDVFEPHNIGFKSVTQPFDTTSSFGKAAIGMLAVFAQLEREQLIERVTDAKREAARQGRYMGGPPAYGYRHDPVAKAMAADEFQANVVRLLYAAYLRGDVGFQGLADRLTAREIPPPRGHVWQRASIRKILMNPVYAGFIPHRGCLYQGQHQAIIPPAQWHEVQELLTSRRKYRPTGRTGLVSGLLYCGQCGSRMRAKNVWQNYPCTDPKKVSQYYVCYSQDGGTAGPNNAAACRCGYKPAEAIDAAVGRLIQQYVLSPRLVREALQQRHTRRQASSTGVAALSRARKDLAQIEKRLARWYDAFETGALTPAAMAARIKELSGQRGHLEQQIAALTAKGVPARTDAVVEVKIAAILNRFRKLWLTATPKEREAIAHNLVRRVLVFPDNRVELDFFPD